MSFLSFTYLPPSPDFFVHIKFILLSAITQDFLSCYCRFVLSITSILWV